jgi:hypothetical protein
LEKLIERAMVRPAAAARSALMLNEILIRDRTTGAMQARDDEPVKLRVCRECFRVHEAPSRCMLAA